MRTLVSCGVLLLVLSPFVAQDAAGQQRGDPSIDELLTKPDEHEPPRAPEFDGRDPDKRLTIAKANGGSAESERAVDSALKWLAKHQLPDGGWSFDHKLAPACGGLCGNPGSATKARNAATGLALLPFLGAGYTHEKGKYKETVKRGIDFLESAMKKTPSGGSLHEPEGRMYSHGLAALALCEAYAMTKDSRDLQLSTQAAVNFICYAQDPAGGGWRYESRQAGDTSVTSWQIAVLKAAEACDLRVQPGVAEKAFGFLDQAQSWDGASYGYTPGASRSRSSSAMGLLCRINLEWERDNAALQRGCDLIAKDGPSRDNIYYNYYATELLRQVGGERWKKWNSVMRDNLVKSQSGAGIHEEGSWFFNDPYGRKTGGRLYCTALSTLTLETYYRHLPVNRKPRDQEEPQQ